MHLLVIFIHLKVHTHSLIITIHDFFLFFSFHWCSGIINYTISPATTCMGPHRLGDIGCSLKVLNQEREYVTSAIGCQGSIQISNASLWWPYLMSNNPGYQYTLMVGNRKDDQYILGNVYWY